MMQHTRIQTAGSEPTDLRAIPNQLIEAMESLLVIIEQETELVRAGKLREATALTDKKSELAAGYLMAVNKLKANAKELRARNPELMKGLRARHELFQAQLQINLTILATMHSIAEGIIRGVAAECTRKAAPQVYGASGRHTTAPARASGPIAVSRSL
jgi:hypothetical protein